MQLFSLLKSLVSSVMFTVTPQLIYYQLTHGRRMLNPWLSFSFYKHIPELDRIGTSLSTSFFVVKQILYSFSRCDGKSNCFVFVCDHLVVHCATICSSLFCLCDVLQGVEGLIVIPELGDYSKMGITSPQHTHFLTAGAKGQYFAACTSVGNHFYLTKSINWFSKHFLSFTIQ